MEFGRVEYICVKQRPGKAPIARVVNLTLIGQGDEDILMREGIRGLRLKRIERITNEAFEQGSPLSYEDLSALLLTSLATLKRDVVCIESRGNTVLLKGRRRNGALKAAAKTALEKVSKDEYESSAHMRMTGTDNDAAIR